MPPRSLTVAIVAFWLATAGWFFARDLYPRYFASDRPPFAINLEEEAHSPPMPRYFMVHRKGKEVERLGSPTTAWDFFINGESAGELLTLIRARENDPHHYDIYTTQNVKNLRSLVRMMPLAGGLDGTATTSSLMRVTDQGELVELEMNTTILTRTPDAIRIEVSVKGKVEDGQFNAEGEVRSGLFKFHRKGEPVEMRSQHGFFDPTRPWSRLYDLQEGKTWRVVYFNPALDSLKQSMLSMVPGLGGQLETPIIEGGVRLGTEDLFWDNREVLCQVIEYRGEQMTGKTFVRKSDGLVLRQEVEDTKSNLTMSLMRRPR